MRLLAPNLVVPDHVVSEIRGVRFSGFPFEWDMAYNNLPCTNVQAVIRAVSQNFISQNRVYVSYFTLALDASNFNGYPNVDLSQAMLSCYFPNLLHESYLIAVAAAAVCNAGVGVTRRVSRNYH
jgi:hypothetical protein